MDSTSTANALDSLQGFLEFLGENGDLVVLEGKKYPHHIFDSTSCWKWYIIITFALAFGRTGRQEPDKRSAVEKCLAKAVSSECVPLQTIDTFLAIVIPTAYPPSNQNAEVSRELQKSCRYLLKSYSRRMFECTLSLKFKFRLKKTAKRFRSLSTTQQQRKIVDVIRGIAQIDLKFLNNSGPHLVGFSLAHSLPYLQMSATVWKMIVWYVHPFGMLREQLIYWSIYKQLHFLVR